MTYTENRSNTTALPAFGLPIEQQPLIDCQLTADSVNSWELSICGVKIGTITRVARWIVDNDDIDRDAEWAYQIRCEIDGGELWEAATAKDATGDLFAYWMEQSGKVPAEPEYTGYDPM
jgi:hypothetical protein